MLGIKLTPDRVRGFVAGKSERELRELLAMVFNELTPRELGIAADELLNAKARKR